MKKFLFLFLLPLVICTKTDMANGSALTGPQLSILAEVVSVGTEQKSVNLKKNDESGYMDLKIIKILEISSEALTGENCPVKEGEIIRVIDNYKALSVGDKIKAGIEIGSTMGPQGPVGFMQWFPVSYEDGREIKDKEGIVVTYFQSLYEGKAISH